MTWETVVGLEVHVQLDTRSKLFCGCSTAFGDPPNTNVCPVCLGLPGALPMTNDRAVELGIRAAVALGSEVQHRSVFARKSYFYPDLPKGYQISQYQEPLARGGVVAWLQEGGEVVEIGVARLHLEEDAGKSLHDVAAGSTGVDFNRAGVPLVEIVSEPQLSSPGDARRYLNTLKRILRYAEVSGCSMEQGSLRVDANISVRPSGSGSLGVKQEIKNLNSFAAVERSLAEVRDRQIETLELHERVEQVTFSGSGPSVVVMRTKEGSTDYRYFADPDLPPLQVATRRIASVRDSLPELPAARADRFVGAYGLAAYEAGILTGTRELADYFEDAARSASAGVGEVANWVVNELLSLWEDSGSPVAVERFVEVVDMVANNAVSRQAGKKLLQALAAAGETRSAAALADELELLLDTDEERLREWVAVVIGAHPEEAARLAQGEDRVIDFLVGKVMSQSRGRADPKRVRDLLLGRR